MGIFWDLSIYLYLHGRSGIVISETLHSTEREDRHSGGTRAQKDSRRPKAWLAVKELEFS